MAHTFTTSYLEDAAAVFGSHKHLADAAIAQVSDAGLYATLDPEMNSIAVLMQHLAGNLRSRWTGFLTSDGEKPGRNRDREFLSPPSERPALLAMWEAGWQCLFGELAPLRDSQLGQTVTIRGEAHAVVQAVNRQLAHAAYHCGQIVFLAKHWAHADWHSLSVPRGQSEEFNQKMRAGEASQR